MDLFGEIICLLFGRIQPEEIYQAILKEEYGEERDAFSKYVLSKSQLDDKEAFFRGADNLLKTYSQEEIDLFRKLSNQLTGKNDREIATVFHLLPGFTRSIISFKNDKPVCEKRFMFKWRAASFELGQDLFLASHKAYYDVIEECDSSFFGWPPIVHANNPLVEETIKKGITENHSHLYGAFPAFDLSWICIMNHPDYIHKINSKENQAYFKDDLKSRIRLNENIADLSRIEKLQLACILRAQLFMYLIDGDGMEGDDEYNKHIDQHLVSSYSLIKYFNLMEGQRTTWLCTMVSELRVMYGEPWLQSNGSEAVLDYAYPTHLPDDRNRGEYRLYVGERYFMYRCFINIFSEKWSGYEMDLFYLYLVIKTEFGHELIQVNRRVGFHNFMDYQNRKGSFWWGRDEYFREGYRIAVTGKMKDQNVVAEEDRFTTRRSVHDVLRQVADVDKEIIFSEKTNYRLEDFIVDTCRGEWEWRNLRRIAKERNNFYVSHFVKSHFASSSMNAIFGYCKPKNYKERAEAKQQALALASALYRYPVLATRIRGIDACNREIGCRPETFATEFRFLRHLRSASVRFGGIPVDKGDWPGLKLTYHAGEDFLDIADGLRSIDEAIRFLDMKRGDRIGHALALGINPYDHYKFKQNLIVTTKQDRLDDLVWLICRSREFNVFIPLDLLRSMEAEATNLIYEIYNELMYYELVTIGHISIKEYYDSCRLRANHPDYYDTVDSFESTGWKIENYYCAQLSDIMPQYISHMRMKDKTADIFKPNSVKKRETDLLMHYYHYKQSVREIGMEAYSVEVSSGYIKLMFDMQEAMINELTERGIFVECNPSSNYLIGTLGDYTHHPLFRFNRYGMEDGSKNNLCISINTDDMGIFDTSLENEYALVAAALEEMMDENGKRRYSDDFILEYLEHLRIMGHRQCFKVEDR